MQIKFTTANIHLIIKKYRKSISIIFIVTLTLLGTNIVYNNENTNPLKGKVDFQLQYRFRLKNDGPLNLTSLSIRLALLKSWDLIQNVTSLSIETTPNKTTTDEYNNNFAWYDYTNFQVNQSLDLKFDVNLTLDLIDYSKISFPTVPYNQSSEIYKRYMAFDPLTDTTDPAIQDLASSLGVNNDIKSIALDAYNFSSTYIKYKLLSTSRGASFALRNGYGDCDEYTTLFIALVRSRGIPAIEQTAWLADFIPGLETTDDGAAAHAYPMFYIPDIGLLPVDPTRGNKKLFDNWLRTDEKRITLTRGPDQPYRLSRYKWVPQEGFTDPVVNSNYTIKIIKMEINYFSTIRTLVLAGLTGIPVIFFAITIISSYKINKMQKEEMRRILSPEI